MLDGEFYDSDQCVFELVRRQVPHLTDLTQVYRDLDGPEFRSYELDALKSLTVRDDSVVATGGGLVSFGPSCQLVVDQPYVVCLRCPLEVLAQRIAAMPPRPMFAVGSIIGKLSSLDSERSRKYEELAKLTVDASQPARAVCVEILRRIDPMPGSVR